MAEQNPTTWTVKRCLDWSRDYLHDKGEQRARFMAETLLASVLGIGRMEMYLQLEKPMDKAELDLMHSYLVRRRKGEPMQYIVGNTQFRTVEIACEPGVLIPRPETEMLVEHVLTYLDREVWSIAPGEVIGRERAELPWNTKVEEARRAEEAAREHERKIAPATAPAAPAIDEELSDGDVVYEPISAAPTAPVHEEVQQEPVPQDPVTPERRCANVLEIGCGTGCVPLSMIAERPGLIHAVSTDINPLAISLACRNRDALGITAEEVDFREGDLVSPVSPQERGTFDVLVSNPPYIPQHVAAQMSREVLDYEPTEALFSGADGLDVFRRIVACAPYMVRPGGLLACELHEEALDMAARICLGAGFAEVRVEHDLPGRPRYILARIPA